MARNIPKIPVFCFVFHVYRINGLALGYHHDLGVLLVVRGLWLGPPGSQVGEITPPGPAEVGWDQNRVVGGDTVSWVPHTSHVFGDKEKLCWFGCIAGCLGALMGSPWVAGGWYYPPRSSWGRLRPEKSYRWWYCVMSASYKPCIWQQRKTRLIWVYYWLFGGSDGVPMGRRWVRLPPRSSWGRQRPEKSCRWWYCVMSTSYWPSNENCIVFDLSAKTV